MSGTPGQKPVVLVAPDPAWRARYQCEAEALRAALGDELVAVHHVGSTSIDGLWAKPIVDVMPVVARIERVDGLRGALEAAGYAWRGEAGIPGRRFVVHEAPHGGDNLANVHIFGEAHFEIERHLAFRDHLRAHRDVAEAYVALKRSLAEKYRNQRERYTEEKSTFIEDVLRVAMGPSYRPPIRP